MSYISHSEFKHLMSKFQAETPKGMLKEAVDVKDRGYQDNITPESPLDEEDEMEEGNAFTGQLHTHKPGEKFKVGGKAYKDTAKGVVPEYKFDQMYPEDPGPFEGEMDDEEAENAERDDSMEEGFNPDESDFEQAVAEQLRYLSDDEMTDKEYEQALELLKDPKIVSKLWDLHPQKAAMALAKMVRKQNREDIPGFGGTWDSLSSLGKIREEDEMDENIYEPLQKATGLTYIQKEDTTGRFSVLSPDERKQLKEYIESLKTIKKEISTLLEKAGKSTMMESDKAGYVKGGEIKNKAKAADTKRPAEIKPKYHNPEKKQKTGGDRTNLVMKKSEMWEGHESDMDPKHEEMESKIDPKLHDVLHKVADKVISELEAAGFTRQEALMFLDHEIAEKGEEAKMDQYNPF